MAAVICSNIMTTTSKDADAGRSGTTAVVGANAARGGQQRRCGGLGWRRLGGGGRRT